MRAYLAVTGTLFGLLTLVHIWRAMVESSRLAADPWFLLITGLSAVLCLWAGRLFLATRPAKSSAT
jgi:hypothetical protein